jgi:segregation and condensation protein A
MEEQKTSFQIKHEQFEGPLEVLLELIEKRKFFVNDISLASVTDDFISHIQTTGMHPDMTANFLSVASTLILIKAKSLLPNIPLTEDENKSISALERRVALYQIISQVSGELIKKYGKAVSFTGVSRNVGPIFTPDPKVTADLLPNLINDIIGRIPPKEAKKPEARVSITISIKEILDTLETRIANIMKCSFDDVVVTAPGGDSKAQKVYTIVSFLGMLEMVRRGIILANQEENFKTISLEKQTS